MATMTSANAGVEALRTAVAWLLLCSATALSWWLGIERVFTSRRAAAVIILTIALLKVRLVISYFMNVRSAPKVLKIACDIWVLLLGAAMIGLYWIDET